MGCAGTSFQVGRPSNFKPQIVVLHGAGGALSLLESRFQQSGANLSCHYGVTRTGMVHQYVLETDTAFHAGVVIDPIAAVVRKLPRVNPNFYSIGIEHEGSPEDEPTQLQADASAALIESIAQRWSIPLDADHIVTHSAIRASARCPGIRFDPHRILQSAIAIRATTGTGAGMDVKIRVNANLRKAPSTSAPVVGRLLAGTPVHIDGYIEGEPVDGNPFWYVDANERYFWAGATDRAHPDLNGEPSSNPVLSTDLMEITDLQSTPEELSVNRRLALPDSQYRNVVTQKDMIVLHFTAGSTAEGAVSGWRSTPARVATAYVVDRDGTIYEIFDPKYWANHLGKMPEVHEKRSIGIEIVNVGPLRPSAENPSQLNWWPTAVKPYSTRYCSIDDREAYVKAVYRGETCFATFPEPQTTAVARLVRHLCDRFSILHTLPGSNVRSQCDQSFATYKGIANHANFRADKWDLGPAYKWDTLGI